MNAVLNYICQTIESLDYSRFKLVQKLYRIQRNVILVSIGMALYIVSTGITLQKQDGKIEQLKKEIKEIKQMKGD